MIMDGIPIIGQETKKDEELKSLKNENAYLQLELQKIAAQAQYFINCIYVILDKQEHKRMVLERKALKKIDPTKYVNFFPDNRIDSVVISLKEKETERNVKEGENNESEGKE